MDVAPLDQLEKCREPDDRHLGGRSRRCDEMSFLLHRSVRAHIRAYGSSADRFAIPEGSPRLSLRVPWPCGRTSMGSACCPRSDLPADASLPSTGSSGASSPASAVLSRRYDFLPPVPPHFVSFAGRYLRVHSLSSLPGGRVHRRSPELLTRSPGRE